MVSIAINSYLQKFVFEQVMADKVEGLLLIYKCTECLQFHGLPGPDQIT